MATSTNDHDDLLDSDNDELEEEVIRDKVTKESFLQLIEKASEGGDLLKVINRLPNSSQRYGHSIAMNAIVKNAALSQIDLLTRRLSENSDRLTNTTEKAMVGLFSPSPTFTDVSASVSNKTSSYVAAKERKVDSERKLLFLKEQIDYHKYVLLSECFDQDEKKNSKKELANLMLELKEHTK